MIGSPHRRVEDRRLVTGAGCYLDDIRIEGLLHAAFVRTPAAHGLVEDIDADEARVMPGVVGVFTGGDLGLDRPMPDMHPHPQASDAVQGHPLAPEEVCYVGEPVAVVVADDPYRAADAASSVFVDVEPLPACADVRSALADGAPSVHRGMRSNLVTTLRSAYGDVEGAFRHATHVIGVRLHQHRGAAASLEPRGVMAEDDGTGLTMWSSTQSPHKVRNLVAEYLDEPGLRVVAPDVGGGFGPKGATYAEEYVIPAMARRLGRPVKWVEGRREHLLTTHQQRDQHADLEVACDSRGRLLGLRGRLLHDNGAYVPYGLLLPLTGLNLIPGPYRLPTFDVAIDVGYTNLVPTSPIRGAGRPNAVFIMERCVDAVAREVGIDPVEVRRRNFVPSDEPAHTIPLPSRSGEPIRYDGGDYAGLLEAAVRQADRPGFPQRREDAARTGLRRGFGVASYVEDTGLGPSEGAALEIDARGRCIVRVGVSSQGQGHATVFAQLVSEVLGIDPEDVEVVSGDTSAYPSGGSTVASRTAVTAAPAVRDSAEKLAANLRHMAADLLEAAAEDLVLADGAVTVAGQPGSEITFSELASHSHESGPEVELTATTEVPFGMAAYAFGSHAVEVEVDPETGWVRVVSYTVAHDCGTVLNPMIVAGQIDGGVAHGLGNALSERVCFDDTGQPLVTTFVDYRIPSSAETPSVVKLHTETPSNTNALGARGAGEGGTIPAMAAVVAAVENALGVVVDRYPLDPPTVLALIRSAGKD